MGKLKMLICLLKPPGEEWVVVQRDSAFWLFNSLLLKKNKAILGSLYMKQQKENAESCRNLSKKKNLYLHFNLGA